MIKKYNILVTGCGGDIGQSIGKILNNCNYVNNLFGIDISDKNAGKFIYKNFSLGLPCNDREYLHFIENFITKNQIDLLLPISEPELRFFTKNRIPEEISGAKVLMASNFACEIGFDKLKTARFLESEKLPFPETNEIKDINEIRDYPVVLKSKTGSGSSKVFVINNDVSFKYYQNVYPEFITQEFIEEDEGEFTCGVFRSKNGIVRTIILKRELHGGFSGYGEVIKNEAINDLLIQVAIKLNLIGSINIQLRLSEKGPIIFEINPRFSSTVLFRHLFGFKDLLWSIEDLFNMPISDYKENSVGKTFYKGFNEYIQ